jgi:membrane fusion protein
VTLQRSLFRHEAIEFQQHHRQWGEVALLQPLSTKILTWCITTVVAVVLAFLFLGHYARTRFASATLAKRGAALPLFMDGWQP